MSKKEARNKLKKRIRAGRDILDLEQKHLKRIAERCSEIIVFTGDEQSARKLSPTLFDEWKARDKNVRAIEALLDELEKEYGDLE